METILLLIGIAISILIIRILIRINSPKKIKTKPSGAIQNQTVPPTGQPKQPTPAPIVAKKKNALSKVGSIIWAIISGAILILLVIFVLCIIIDFFTFMRPYTYSEIVEKRITVSFTKNYGDIHYLEKGKGLSFEDATNSYCVENLKGEEACSKGREDISPMLPPGNANTGLKFKSRNRSPGQVNIAVWITVRNDKTYIIF